MIKKCNVCMCVGSGGVLFFLNALVASEELIKLRLWDKPVPKLPLLLA